MNILYISNLSNNIDAGLNWSVPAGVKAQQLYDNVLWVDINPNAFQEQFGKVEAYHNIKEYGGKIQLTALPKPFNNLDFVVFEGFFMIKHVLFARKLHRQHIPYIIIPRGSLTRGGFCLGGWKKHLKKEIGCLLLFNRYVRHAVAIQYLTNEEQKESTYRFHTHSFVIPNGFSTPETQKGTFSKGIRAVFIGRLDMFHKGLDLLIEAIASVKENLIKAGFTLDIYGSVRDDTKDVLSTDIEKNNLSSIIHNHRRVITGEEKKNVLLASDVFILTSRFEGHPMGLIEALSYGLPCLITRGANMYDEVLRADAGWVSETNIDGIKQSLLKMIAEKDKFLEKSNNAKQLAKKYDWNVLALDFHQKLLTLKKENNGLTI